MQHAAAAAAAAADEHELQPEDMLPVTDDFDQVTGLHMQLTADGMLLQDAALPLRLSLDDTLEQCIFTCPSLSGAPLLGTEDDVPAKIAIVELWGFQ